MARPIKETPILTSRDAVNFFKNMQDANVKKVPESELERIKANADKLRDMEKEEAKTVEENKAQSAFYIYEKNCVRDANLIIPVNPVITVVGSMIEYSSQQNT